MIAPQFNKILILHADRNVPQLESDFQENGILKERSAAEKGLGVASGSQYEKICPTVKSASDPRVIFALHFIIIIKYNFDFLSSVYYFRSFHIQAEKKRTRDIVACAAAFLHLLSCRRGVEYII